MNSVFAAPVAHRSVAEARYCNRHFRWIVCGQRAVAMQVLFLSRAVELAARLALFKAGWDWHGRWLDDRVKGSEIAAIF